jgi:hypothetical protein
MVVSASIVLLYASCKKEGNTSTQKTPVDYKAMSGKIALSLFKGITGQYGGTDVSKGINLPSNIHTNARPGLRLNDLNSLCGFVVDTTFNTNTTSGDTTTTQFGNFHFVYTCSASTPDGYTVHDSLNTVQTWPKFTNKYIVAQNYVVKALDQTYKVVSMNGSIYTYVYSLGSGYYELSSAYKLNNLVVNFTSGTADVTSGTSTFTMFGYQQSANPFDDGHPVGDTGTITFIGNHQATLTIGSHPGVTYLVNLQTGVVTQQ